MAGIRVRMASMTLDERTARDAAGVRAKASIGAAVLSALVALLAGVFALGAPAEAQPLLVAACVLSALSALACVVVVGANRSLAGQPTDPRPRALSSATIVGLAVGWLVAVAGVVLATGDVGYSLAALALGVLVLPAVVVAALTVKGPHPAATGMTG